MRRSFRVLAVTEAATAGLVDTLELRTEFATETAPTARAAIQRLSAADEPPIDCLVAGYDLPERTGLDLCRSVRDLGRDLPILIVTACGSEQIAGEAIAAGVDGYVPVEPAEQTDGERLVERLQAIADESLQGHNRPQYQHILDTIPAGVVVLDENARIVVVNETAATTLGLADTSESTGLPFQTLVEDGTLGDVMGQEYDTLLTELLSSPDDRPVATCQFELASGVDEERICEVTITPLPRTHGGPGSVGVVRDITDRTRHREELGRYETIIDAIPDPVYALDENGLFEYVNDAVEDMAGYDAERGLEEGIFLGMTQEDIERAQDTIRDMLSESADVGEKTTFEMDLITKDGRTIPVENHMGLLPYDEEFQGTAGILRDISSRKRRKRRLDVLDTVLRHNLRNITTVIIGHAEEIGHRVDDPDLQVATTEIQQKASQLIEMSDEIRHLQQAIEADRSDERSNSVDIVPITEEILANFREEYPDADITADLPETATVVADGTIRRALVNLVENAIEHNDDDPTVTVSVSLGNDPPQSAASDTTTGQWVTVSVADDGPGIPEYERELVAEKQEITQLYHGSGLGLWVVVWIVETFDGTVSITDNDPAGTVVTLRLRQTDSHSA